MATAVNIMNWGGMRQPLEAMNSIKEANYGQWAGEFIRQQNAWRDWQAQRQKEWLDINYGEEGNRYEDNPQSGGGVYGDARRSEEKWRKIQLAIAALQQAASLYFADKQYKAAKEAREHQMDVWRTEREWAKRYQDTWYNKYLPLEMSLLNKVKARLNDPNYVKPKYDVARSRAVITVRSEFAKAREKIRKCYDPRCIGFSCNSLKQLAIEEAKAATGAIEKAYRAEEARADVKRAELEESVFSLAKLGRGLADSSLGALNAASRAAEIAATYKPYEGYERAVGGATGYWLDYASRRYGESEGRAGMLGSQAQSYMMTQGMYSKPDSMLVSGTAAMPQITINAPKQSTTPYLGDTSLYFDNNADGSYANDGFVVDMGRG